LIQAKIEHAGKKAILEKLKVDHLKEKADPRAVYVFIQFQSMNGKEKFIKAVSVFWLWRFLYRTCCCCRLSHEEI